MATRVELSRRAQRDFRNVAGADRARIVAALRDGLTADPPPANLDVVRLTGREPWLRMRIGNWRILFRPMTREELDVVEVGAVRGFLVARIVNRRELERAVEKLPQAGD